MGLVDLLRSRGTLLAEEALRRVFADEARAQRISSFLSSVQEGRRTVARLQEQAWRSVGLASGDDLREAARRLTQLRRAARALDEKLDALQKRVGPTAPR